MFHSSQRLRKARPTRRYTDYVLIPTRPHLPLSEEDIELIKMGESTILRLENESAKPCPKVLFLGQAAHLPNETFQPHVLPTYQATIKRESQYPFRLTVAAHGDPFSIGCASIPQRMSFSQFAHELASTLICTLPRKNIPIHITFDSCNSAYAFITEDMKPDEIAKRIRQDSFIGQFATEMAKLGFSQVTVTGYRGYYKCISTHSGALVASDASAKPALEMTAVNAKFTILPNGQVILPTSTKGLFFPVILADEKLIDEADIATTASTPRDKSDESFSRLSSPAALLMRRRAFSLSALPITPRPTTPIPPRVSTPTCRQVNSPRSYFFRHSPSVGTPRTVRFIDRLPPQAASALARPRPRTR